MPIHISTDPNTGASRIVLQTGQSEVALPALWLRERACSADQRDVSTGQRLFNPHKLPADISIQVAQLESESLQVTFSDGYTGCYQVTDLQSQISPPPLLPEIIHWKNDVQAMPRFNWHKLDEPGDMLAAMKAYLQYGYIVVEDTPTDEGDFFDITRRFGFVKETAHGRSYEVVSRPVYNDLAYQPVALGLHTDMPYSNPGPGVQILQCRVNETRGGLSTLADSLACCAALRKEDPDAYQLLADVVVRFEYHDANEAIILDRPLLNIDETGELVGVRYSPRLDYMPLLDETRLQAYQRARYRLQELFVSDEFQLQFGLKNGELIMFDNSRVLHGRTAYNPEEGLRHLQGCYLDRDGPAIRYMTLCRDYGEAGQRVD